MTKRNAYCGGGEEGREINVTGVIVVPFRGKTLFRSCPQNEIRVPLTGSFKNFRQSPMSLLYGSPLPPGGLLQGTCAILHVSTEQFLVQLALQYCCKRNCQFTSRALITNHSETLGCIGKIETFLIILFLTVPDDWSYELYYFKFFPFT